MPAAFEIVENDGTRVASNGSACITLFEGAEGRMFRRRAVKGAGSENAQAVEWAVAELDGVRCYFDGQNVIVTRKDMLP